MADAIPDRTAIVCGAERRTFAELEDRSNMLAHHLADAGVRAGDHVGMFMRNSVEFVESLLACLKIRAVPININYRYVDAELTYLFTNAELVALIADGEFAPTISAVLPAAPGIGHVVTVGPADEVDWGTATAVDYHEAADEGGAERDFAARSDDDQFIIYTGGTTGMPKGVMWRQEDFFYAALTGGNPFGDPRGSAEEVAAAVPHIPPMTWMLTAPLIHGAALYSLFTAFFVGATHVLMPKFDAHQCLALIERERVMTMTVVGDAMARPLADAVESHGPDHDLSSLLVVGSGGALFSKSVREQLTRLLPALMVRDGFGASESGVDGNLEIGADGTMRISAKPSVRVGAVIEARDGLEAPGVDELVEHCRTQVAGYKVPRVVVGVPSIVRSPSGKADYRWAAATLEEHAAAPHSTIRMPFISG